MAKSAAWTRKEGKNQKGGLNEKGRKSYEREHPRSEEHTSELQSH